MGYDTDFYGKLKFNRKLSANELSTLDKIINVARHSDDCEVSEALQSQAEAARAIERDGNGALVFDPHEGANLRAGFQDLITGDDLSPHYARALRISDDKSGLVYCAEKTYDMVAGVNFIIANGCARIPGFGLKGSLYAETEFEPYEWLLRINAEGWAEQVPCRLTDLPVADQKLYRKEKDRMWLDWSQRCAFYRLREKHKVLNAGYERHHYAKYGRPDARSSFRKAADAVCFGVIEFGSRIQGRFSHEWDRLTHG